MIRVSALAVVAPTATMADAINASPANLPCPRVLELLIVLSNDGAQTAVSIDRLVHKTRPSAALYVF
jgi:hypothetical protein